MKGCDHLSASLFVVHTSYREIPVFCTILTFLLITIRGQFRAFSSSYKVCLATISVLMEKGINNNKIPHDTNIKTYGTYGKSMISYKGTRRHASLHPINLYYIKVKNQYVKC